MEIRKSNSGEFGNTSCRVVHMMDANFAGSLIVHKQHAEFGEGKKKSIMWLTKTSYNANLKSHPMIGCPNPTFIRQVRIALILY